MILPASCEALAKAYESLLRGLKIGSCVALILLAYGLLQELGNKRYTRPFLGGTQEVYKRMYEPVKSIARIVQGHSKWTPR